MPAHRLNIGGRIPWSALGGTQVERTLAWYRDPMLGHWCLFVKNADGSYTVAGYYPQSLCNGGQMSKYSQNMNVGGEVYYTSSPSKVPMGSGKNPGSYARLPVAAELQAASLCG